MFTLTYSPKIGPISLGWSILMTPALIPLLH